MIRYKEFRPTGADAKGLGLEDKQDWFVLPVSRNRDSELLAESNFSVALEMVGGESETVEIHRFGHWACGWFEIVIIQPGSEAENKGWEIEAALENYPVLSDEDYSNKQLEAHDSEMCEEFCSFCEE